MKVLTHWIADITHSLLVRTHQMTRQEAVKIALQARAKNIQPLKERFWSKVNIRGDDECWPWMASVRNKKEGYGAFWLNGKHQPSSRVVLILDGRFKDGLQALHRCDNPSCCNPLHIFLGTSQENNADKVTKNRHAFGSKNGYSKLTEEQAAFIKSKVPMDGKPHPGLRQGMADKFGVSVSCINDVVTRRWRHI